jgi:excisionase family DNA binding protein
MTGRHAAKRLGISLTTLRRLVREGSLWTVPMNAGGVGLSESEVQRFIDRLDKPVQKGK